MRRPLAAASSFCLLMATAAAAATAAAGETQSNSVSSAPPPQASATAQAPSSSDQQPAQPTQPQPTPRPLNPTQEVAGEVAEGPSIAVGPAQLRIGGYLGVTGLYRSTNAGGGTGTSFASFPYEDELQGNVSESRLTAQASRITIRVDADFPEGRPRFRKLGGYFEMDFNGEVSGTFAVTSTSAGFRLRHAFAEVQYSDSFYMGVGQAFSLMTPQKDQVSMWPSDVEISQAVDTNYLAGLLWGRIPQFRLAWRPSRSVQLGLLSGEPGAAAWPIDRDASELLRERTRRAVQHRVRRNESAQPDARHRDAGGIEPDPGGARGRGWGVAGLPPHRVAV